jgi:hypothetical protein
MRHELSKEMRELIEEITDEFDFEVVHRTMKALDWTWYGSVESPSIGDLRRQARELLQELLRNDNYHLTGTGGLFAYRIADTVGLRFEVTSYEVEKDLPV